MGINGAVEKRISQGEPVPETVYAALPLKLLLFTLVTATVLYLSPIINPYIGVEVAYLIPVTILLKNISDLLRRSLNGDMRVEETAYMIGVEQLGWVLFGTLFAQVGTESFALIHGYIAALVIVVTIGLVKVPLAPVKPDKKEQHHFFQYGKYDIISEAGWRVYNWTDVLIAGVFLSPALVGAYEIVWRLTGVTVLFGWAVRNSTFPIVSSLEADGRHEIIESVVQRSMSLSLIFVIPALFGTLVLGEEILRIFFDIRSPIVEIVFIIIMVQKLFQAIEQVTGYTLRGMNKPNLAAIATLVAVCTNIALNTMLIPRFGLVGAAVATLLSYIALVSVETQFLSKSIKISVPTEQIGWYCLSAGIMAALIFCCQTNLCICGENTVVNSTYKRSSCVSIISYSSSRCSRGNALNT